MQDSFDVSKARPARDIPHLVALRAANKGAQENAVKGKTRITIMLDTDVIEAFRARAQAQGSGYQTAINAALRAALAPENAPVTLGAMRELLKQMNN